MHTLTKTVRYRAGAFAAVAVAAALPAVAQQATVSLDQMERRYSRMNLVHIEKCDYDGDGQFTRAEQLCVAGIYQQMYLDRR